MPCVNHVIFSIKCVTYVLKLFCYLCRETVPRRLCTLTHSRLTAVA